MMRSVGNRMLVPNSGSGVLQRAWLAGVRRIESSTLFKEP